MKRTMIICVAVISISLVGCSRGSSQKEEKTAVSTSKIGVIDDDASKDTSKREVEAESALTDEEVEDIIRKALEEAEQAKKTASDFNIDELPEEKETAEGPADDNMSMNQKNAIKAAQDYLELTSFSHNGLVEQLSSEFADKYPREDAEFAVRYLEDHGMVDWNEQAVKAAQEYLELTSFSREGLIDQLTSEYGSQFTREQAEYAADKVGY